MQTATRIYGQNAASVQTAITIGDHFGGLQVTQIMHSKMHSGCMFVASKYLGSIADSASVGLGFTTPAVHVHAFMSVMAGGDAHVELYDSACISSGTALAAYNYNRYEGTDSASTTIVYNPTASVTTNMTLLFDTMLPGGTGPKTPGGEANVAEFIMDTTTCHLLRITNVSGGAKTFAVAVNFIEASD